MTQRITIFSLAMVLWLFITLCTSFNSLVATTIGGVAYVLLLYFYMLLFLQRRKDNHHVMPRNGLLYLLLFLCIYVIAYQFIVDYPSQYISLGISFAQPVWSIVIWLPCALSAYFLAYKLSDKQMRLCAKVVITIYIINMLLSLYYLSIDPLAAKISATGDATYWRVSGYGGVYSSVIIMPILLAMVHNRKSRILLFGFIILSAYYVFKCSFTIAIIALALGVVSYFILKIERKRLRYAVIMLALLFMIWIYLSGAIINVTAWMADIVELWGLESVSLRFNEISRTLQIGEIVGDSTIRIQMYLDSIQYFIKSPLVGNFIFTRNVSNVVSGHSTVLDLLASIGLVGTIPLFIFLYKVYEIGRNRSISNNMKRALISCHLVFIFIATFNPVLGGGEIIISLLFVVPALITLGEGGSSKDYSRIGQLRHDKTRKIRWK